MIELHAGSYDVEWMLACQKKLEQNKIEDVVFVFGRTRFADFGSLCFSRKEHRKCVMKAVDPASLIESRRDPLRLVAVELITLCFTKLSLLTCASKSDEFRKFITWADANGHVGVLDSMVSYRTALVDYSAFMLTTDLNAKSIRIRQSVCFEMGLVIFPEVSYNEIRKGVPHPSFESTNQNSVDEAPAESDIARYVYVCQQLFVSLTDFLLSEESFPFQIPLDTGTMWLTVAELPFVSEAVLALGRKHSAGHTIIDYSTGQTRTWDYYRIRSSLGESPKRRYFKRMVGQYDHLTTEANNEIHHQRRLRLARYAHDCFLVMFSAISGMNEAPVINLPWNGDFEIVSGGKGMKVVKVRALNKVIEFTIRAPFVKYFLRFLKLREYVFEGENFDYLFFTIPLNGEMTIRPLDLGRMISIHTFLTSMVDPNLRLLSYGDFRSYKDNYLAKSHGAQVAGVLLNHSPATQRKNYLKANEKSAVDQIVEFFEFAIVFFDSAHPVETPVGGCQGDGEPIPVMSGVIHAESSPDCTNLAGCIFCEKYRLHANLEDARKLISMEFVIKEMIMACEDVQHFSNVYSQTLKAIRRILGKMVAKDSRMELVIQTVREKIYSGNELTDYWQRQLERLVNLGVLK